MALCHKKAKPENPYLESISYKKLITMVGIGLICTILILFSIYSYYEYRHQYIFNAEREAERRSGQIVANFVDRMEEIQDYYLTAIESENVNWMIENIVSLSDYSHYTGAFEVLNRKKENVSGFALINYKSNYVLSNKGMSSIEKIQNMDFLEEYFFQDHIGGPKSYWIYIKEPDRISLSDKNYRLSVDTEGLNMVFELPFDSFPEYAKLVINISPEKYAQWIQSWLNEGEQLVILDENQKAVYASDNLLLEECIDMQKEKEEISGLVTKRSSEGEKSFIISAETFVNALNWDFYLIFDMNGFRLGKNLSVVWFVTVGLVLAFLFCMAGMVIYRPIRLLRNEMAIKDGVKGNEIYYLSDRFRHLNKDKTTLEEIVLQQKNHLEELFEYRLIRGEIEEQEWNDYIEKFGRKPKKCFVSIVIVLASKENGEEQNSLNEDAICLRILQEMPEEVKEMPWMPAICQGGTIYAILAEEKEMEIQDAICIFYQKMKEYIENVFGIGIRVGISAVHTDYRHIHNSYRESVNALLAQNLTVEGGRDETNKNGCFYYLPDFASVHSKGEKRDFYFETAVRRSIRSMDEQESLRLTDELIENLEGTCKPIEEARIRILNYVNEILLTAIQMRVDVNRISANGIGRIYHDILDGFEYSKIRGYVKQILQDIFKERQEYVNDSSEKITARVHQLIEQHKGNLTLYECAELLEMDSSYVWKALNLVCGKAFSNLVEEYKLEEAKKMLLQTDMKVNDIPAELGYSNTQNFIRFFSKCTGMTPGKYRRLN